MKPIRWSSHALKNPADREITREDAQRTLTEPEVVQPVRQSRRFLMRRYFDPRLEQRMLLRLLVEEAPAEDVVITVYSTSKIDKYMRGTNP